MGLVSPNGQGSLSAPFQGISSHQSHVTRQSCAGGQAEIIAQEGPELAKKLPPAIRKACDKKRVPDALKADLQLLADMLEEHVVPKVVDFTKQAPQKAQEAREAVEPAVDKASKVGVGVFACVGTCVRAYLRVCGR